MKTLQGPILTAVEMRAAEEEADCPLAELMERAGAALADAVWRYGGGARTLILCGPGNNGGDGYVAARLLAARGVDVSVAATGDPRAALAQEARKGWTGPVSKLWEAHSAPVVVDALFGTGLRARLEGDWVSSYWELAEETRFRIAVDLPSGIETDTGADLGAARADLTVALGALKPAHLLQPAAGPCGHIEIAQIGVPAWSHTHTLDRPILRAPGPEDHKYTRGYVAVVGGAMGGAALLSAQAAMRLAGYVAITGAKRTGPNALVHRRWEDLAADKRIGALLIGPGLGRDETAKDKLGAALATEAPLVLDADALAILDLAALKGKSAVLTPHRGEFAALFGDLPGSAIDRARMAAAQSGAVVVLKGANTVVAEPGGKARVAQTAPGWLASAGTGDVLAGLIAAMLSAQSDALTDPFDAACTAVWLHGEAARLAGPAFTADDLIGHVPAAVAACL